VVRWGVVRQFRGFAVAVAVALAVGGGGGGWWDEVRFVAVLSEAAAGVVGELEADGFTIRQTYQVTFDGVVGVGPRAAVDAFGEDRRVEAFEVLGEGEPFTVDRSGPVSIPGGVPVVYVVDSPVEVSHPWFAVEGVELVEGFEQYVCWTPRSLAL